MNTLQQLFPVGPGLDAACRAFAIPQRVPASAQEVALLATATRSTLKVDGQDIACWTFGSGPAVLLVHGWCSRGSHLMAFVEPLLASGRRVVLFDAPGHGDSEGQASSMIHAGRTTLALATAMGDFQSLISHSGGSTAALWALANGLRVEKSVHICGPSSMKQVVIDSARLHGLDPQQALAFQHWVEAFTQVSLDSADLAPLTSALAHQGLIVHDLADRVVDITQSRALHAAWSGSRLIATEGLGHRRIISDPMVVSRIIEFIGTEI